MPTTRFTSKDLLTFPDDGKRAALANIGWLVGLNVKSRSTGAIAKTRL